LLELFGILRTEVLQDALTADRTASFVRLGHPWTVPAGTATRTTPGKE
jgi:hypothetical protein